MAYDVSRGSLLVGFDSRSLNQLQRDLRNVDKDAANALKREMRAGANLLRDGLRRAAVDTLSDMTNKGGSNEGTSAKYGIKSSVGNSGAKVKWEATKGKRGFTQRNATNQGYVRHPLYGNRGFWYDTSRPHMRGWWDKAEEKHLDEAGDKIVDALDNALRSVAAFTS